MIHVERIKSLLSVVMAPVIENDAVLLARLQQTVFATFLSACVKTLSIDPVAGFYLLSFRISACSAFPAASSSSQRECQPQRGSHWPASQRRDFCRVVGLSLLLVHPSEDLSAVGGRFVGGSKRK